MSKIMIMIKKKIRVHLRPVPLIEDQSAFANSLTF